MYRARKVVADAERFDSRVPEDIFKMRTRRDLMDNLMLSLNENGLDAENYLFRFTSRREIVEHFGGRYWETHYELTAVPLEDARVLIGRD